MIEWEGRNSIKQQPLYNLPIDDRWLSDDNQLGAYAEHFDNYNLKQPKLDSY